MKTNRLLAAVAVLVLLGVVGCVPRHVAGIDYPISDSGVTFKFYSATVTTDPIVFWGQNLVPDHGGFVLVVRGFYTGDFALYQFGGSTDELFYVTDAQGNKEIWKAIETLPSKSGVFNIYIAFLLPKTGTAPYVLHSSIGKAWSVDTTHLVGK